MTCPQRGAFIRVLSEFIHRRVGPQHLVQTTGTWVGGFSQKIPHSVLCTLILCITWHRNVASICLCSTGKPLLFTKRWQLQFAPKISNTVTAASTTCQGRTLPRIKSGRSDSKPSETCSAVTGTLHASLDHFFGRHFAMACQTEHGHQIYEECGRVDSPGMLAGGVIRREDMVVVVEALAACTESNGKVLAGVNAPVVRPVADEVCHAVDGPCNIEDGDIAEYAACKEGRPGALVPVIDRYNGRHNEA